MKPHHFQKSKISQICSFEAYEWLQRWIADQYPGYSYPMTPKDYFYRNTKHRQYLSKFIESVIVKVMRSLGADPIKADDKGITVDKTEQVTDVMGRQRTIGSVQWVKNTKARPGRADIVVFYKGMLNLEVKVGNDRQSPDQLREQQRAEQNGEQYIVIKTIDDFLSIISHK